MPIRNGDKKKKKDSGEKGKEHPRIFSFVQGQRGENIPVSPISYGSLK